MLFSEFINEAKSQEFILTREDIDIKTGESQDSIGGGRRSYRVDVSGYLTLQEQNSADGPIKFYFSFSHPAKGFDHPQTFSAIKVYSLSIDTANKLPHSIDKSIKGSIFKGIIKMLNKNLDEVVIKL